MANEKTTLTEVKIASLGGNGVLAKCEYENPSGSHKYRVYHHIIRRLEEEGKITPGMTLIDASSLNGGAALAYIGRERGYKIKIVTLDSMSREKIAKVQSYGGEVIFLHSTAPKGYYNSPEEIGDIRTAAEAIAKKEGFYYLNQGSSDLNVHACRTMGQEIIEQLAEKKKNPDYFICGAGTGGTIMGVGSVLKENYPSIKVICVEPDNANALEAKLKKREARNGAHALTGIGAGDASEGLVDISLLEDVVLVSEEEWKSTLCELVEKDYRVGKSSAGEIAAIKKLGQQGHKGVFLTIFFDRLENYLSEFSEYGGSHERKT